MVTILKNAEKARKWHAQDDNLQTEPTNTTSPASVKLFRVFGMVLMGWGKVSARKGALFIADARCSRKELKITWLGGLVHKMAALWDSVNSFSHLVLSQPVGANACFRG
jgi:hypothetical protein